MIKANISKVGLSSAPRATRDDKIFNELYSAIVEHLIPPGTKLPEDMLADIYGASRTNIRKVLMQLAAESIVTLTRNRGASVTSPSIKEALEVFETRRILELRIVAAVAKEPTDLQLASLRKYATQEFDAHHQHDRRTQIKLSGEFHMKLAEFAGNQTLIDILRMLVSRTSLIIAVYETRRGSGCQFGEHQELVELIAQRNVEGAVAKMEQHLLEIEASLDLVKQRPREINLQEVLGNSRKAGSTQTSRHDL